MRKKLSALVLSVCMVVAMMPVTAFATQYDIPAKDSAGDQFAEKVHHEADGEKVEAAPRNNAGDSIKAKPVVPETYLSGDEGAASETDATMVAEVNGQEFSTVQAAIDAAEADDVVTMLDNAEESIYIDKDITFDMDGCWLYTNSATDTITVASDYVVIENGWVDNLNSTPDDHATAIYIVDGACADVYDVAAMTVGGTATEQESSSFYIGNGASGYFTNCEVYYDDDYVTEEDWINGAYIEAGGYGEFDGCDLEILKGDCCYVNGDAIINECYFTAEETISSAINAGADAGTIWLLSGYYFGDPAIWIDADSEGDMRILEGEFHSADKDHPAFDGNVSCVGKYNYGGENIITSPTYWKTGSGNDHVFFYEGVAAPTTVSSYLTSTYGKYAGYDDIKTTWSKSSKADGYRVSYKRGTGSYTGSKYYSKNATRSRVVADLYDGYKYTFKVTPYVLVNEDLLEGGGTKCYSNKYKTDYAYTLKKVVLSTFSKSSGKVKVTWKNISGETGYEISKSTKSTGTNVVYTYKTTSATSKLISATKGKYYYYKVRAYKKVGDTTIYGPWSSAKKYKR